MKIPFLSLPPRSFLPGRIMFPSFLRSFQKYSRLIKSWLSLQSLWWLCLLPPSAARKPCAPGAGRWGYRAPALRGGVRRSRHSCCSGRAAHGAGAGTTSFYGVDADMAAQEGSRVASTRP